MSFHIQDKIDTSLTVKSIIAKDKNNKIIAKLNAPFEFLDSTGDISVPTPAYELSSESRIINLTQKSKSAPIIINSASESPARIKLSITNKTFPANFISFNPSSPQEIGSHGRTKFDLVYNGSIDKSSSHLLPIDISVYPRIDSVDPNKVIYSDTPSNTTSSIVVYLSGN
jgi:hypothetical protein